MKEKIKIAIIGLGYVGLPLARLFATKYPVVGFDINTKRVGELKAVIDSTLEIEKEVLQKVLVSNLNLLTQLNPKVLVLDDFSYSNAIKDHQISQTTYRSITLDNKEIEFCNGFFDLHTKSYKDIIDGKGFGLADAKPSVQLVHDIRNAELSPLKGEYHPLVKYPQMKHPFTNTH
ncbi:MAG: hypothetical protein ACJASR_001665 [Psychroserpens sp.]|jgi:hypothetical protein